MSEKKPNIIFIITDQQSATALSCVHDSYVNTPNLDKLAAKGIRFDRAYACNPVCIPSRTGMFTGMYPTVIDMECNDNHKNNVPQEVLDNSMGNMFRKAGYDTVYGGKIHLPGPSPVFEKVEPYGFEFIERNYRDILTDSSIEYLRKPHEKPFLMVSSYVNPHDICYYAFNEYNLLVGKPLIGHWGTLEWDAVLRYKEELSKLSPEDLEKTLPQMPDNYDVPENELSCFQKDKPDFYCHVRTTWTEKEFRQLRYFYKRFVERVDRKIGRLLDEIYDSGLEENTMIVFVSDHGDMQGSHHTDGKGYLYEECTNVPLFVVWKGEIEPGQVDNEHLVSGLDILPTMYEAAGIEIPASLEGMSLLPLAKKEDVKWRTSLMVENDFSRLFHFGDWKYMVGTDRNIPRKPECDGCSWHCHERPEVREQVTNISIDPGESRNMAGDPEAEKIITEGRRLMRERYAKTGREIDKTYVI